MTASFQLRALLLGNLAFACIATPYEDTATGTTSGTGISTTEVGTTATTSLPPPTTSTPTTGTTTTTASTTTDATSSPADPCRSFLCPFDGQTDPFACDPWVQDCPPGQKCNAYSGVDDNGWQSLGCFPVAPNPGQHGEPCIAEGGGLSGIDTCDVAHLCWNVDPDTGEGHCVKFCGGSPDMATCDIPKTDCATSGNSVLALCLPTCDPIEQDCQDGHLCIAHPTEPNRWICVLDASLDEGQEFDPCEYPNACDPGLACLDPAFATECDPMAPGCCIKFCDLTNPVCTGQGAVCVPWYEEGQEPPGYEHVGLCRLPP